MSEHKNEDTNAQDANEGERPRQSLRRRLRRLGQRLPRSNGALAGSPPGAGGRLLQL